MMIPREKLALEALHKYGNHDRNCAWHVSDRCSCGYDQAIAALTEPQPLEQGDPTYTAEHGPNWALPTAQHSTHGEPATEGYWVLERIDLDGELAKNGWILQSGCLDDIAKYIGRRLSESRPVVSREAIERAFWGDDETVAKGSLIKPGLDAIYSLQLSTPSATAGSGIEEAVRLLQTALGSGNWPALEGGAREALAKLQGAKP